ncbi:MAG: MATE family efflux transporter [Roseiflexaceae bacterium]|nr:MATE family efflux transporter [Roseiflexaceae bacterium]
MAVSTNQARRLATRPSRQRRVFKLALPAVGEQVLNTTVGLVDTFLIGNLTLAAAATLGYSGTQALNGVGLANQMVWLVTMFFAAVGVGATAIIARARGAQDMLTANQALKQSLLLGLLLGLASSLLMYALAPAAMQLLGADATIAPLGVNYLRTVAISFVPTALLFLGTAALRGVGDTRMPLLVMLGVNAVNIVVCLLLINGTGGLPALGVEGAALGAAIGRGGGGVFLVALLLWRGRSGLKLDLDLRPQWDMLKRIARIGMPSGGEQLVFQGALLVFVRFVTGLGTASYAAHNVVLNIESLSFLPGMGYAIAASTLVGQNLGASKPEDAQADAYEAQRQGLIMMSALGLIMLLFPRQLLGLFSSDPAVLAAGVGPMRIAGLFQPLLAINFIMSGALRGAGDTRWPLFTKLVSTWGIRLPLVMLLLTLGFGLNGIWIAMATDFGVQAALAWWRFEQGRWKAERV